MKRALIPCVGLAAYFAVVGVSAAQQKCTAPSESSAAEKTLLVGDCQKEPGCSYTFDLVELGHVRLSKEADDVALTGCQGGPPSDAVNLKYQNGENIKKTGSYIQVSKGKLFVDSIDGNCGRVPGHTVKFRFECD